MCNERVQRRCTAASVHQLTVRVAICSFSFQTRARQAQQAQLGMFWSNQLSPTRLVLRLASMHHAIAAASLPAMQAVKFVVMIE